MRSLRTLLAIVILLVVPSAVRAEMPPVFSDVTFEDALEASKTDDRLLIVDATAVWCGPCKKMDRTTWIDGAVVKWIEANGRAIQVDVDRARAAARALRVRAMPTVVAIRNGAEVDRVVGYRNGAQLLAWLDGLGRGETALDRTREEAGTRTDERVDVGKRLELARTLAQSDRLDEATDEYTWLWRHMLEHQPSMSGVRLSFMANEMTDLATRHPAARTTFRTLRDDLSSSVESGTATRPEMLDWLHLCEIIGDGDSVLAWWERFRDDPKRRPDADRLAKDVFGLFVARQCWADAGRVFRAPAAHISSMKRRNEHGIASLRRVRPDDAEAITQLEEANHRTLRRTAAMLHAALLAANRPADAREVARLLLESQNDADARIELVRQSLAAGTTSRDLARWLDEAESRGADVSALRTQLATVFAE